MQFTHNGNAEAALPFWPATTYDGRMTITDHNPTSDNTLLTPEALLRQFQWRAAVKKFDQHRQIDSTTWSALEEVLRLSPSSGGLQPWKFIVVTDPAIREKLVTASFGQTQVKDASHLVVFAAKKKFGTADVDAHVRNTAALRNVPVETLDGFRGMLVGTIQSKDSAAREAWAARQTYIALGVLISAAAVLGVDAGPMEGFLPDQYDDILGLKEQGLTATVICAVGYRSEDDQYARAPKVRFDASKVFLHV